MLCQNCGKNTATTHIKTIINGKITEQNLCGYCAAKNGYSNNSITGLLSSMIGHSLKGEQTSFEKKCDCCGSTFADIAEAGKVGCAACYKIFESELLPYLKRIHGSVNHVGKTQDSKQLAVTEVKDNVSELKRKLAELVAAERYEEAAVVRDEIKRQEEE